MQFVWLAAVFPSARSSREPFAISKPKWWRQLSMGGRSKISTSSLLRTSATWSAPPALGEALRLVLLSVTEGEDKPLKYPTIFNTADVAVLTKIDLATAVEFDLETAMRNIEAVRPGMKVLATSAKTGQGVEELLALITSAR